MILQRAKNAQYFLTIPITIVRAKEWERGDDIKIYVDKQGNILLKKAKDIPEQPL